MLRRWLRKARLHHLKDNVFRNAVEGNPPGPPGRVLEKKFWWPMTFSELFRSLHTEQPLGVSEMLQLPRVFPLPGRGLQAPMREHTMFGTRSLGYYVIIGSGVALKTYSLKTSWEELLLPSVSQ